MPASATGRLLVIDDDPAVHELVEEVLGGVGYSIEHARSGEEGLSRARSRAPDLIVLDLLLDGMSGFQVADELRRDRRTRGVPVVVLTALEPTAQDRARLRGSVEAVRAQGRRGHGGPGVGGARRPGPGAPPGERLRGCGTVPDGGLSPSRARPGSAER